VILVNAMKVTVVQVVDVITVPHCVVTTALPMPVGVALVRATRFALNVLARIVVLDCVGHQVVPPDAPRTNQANRCACDRRHLGADSILQSARPARVVATNADARPKEGTGSMLRGMKDLEQYAVRATDGDIGNVSDFLFEDTSWRVRYLVVDTGGFLSRREVLIRPVAFDRVDYSANRFRLTLSTMNVDNSPTVNVDLPVSRQSEPHDRAPIDRLGEVTSDTHLRSVRAITGYHVEAKDGPTGHIRDLVVDDETWVIRYMVIATANWWPSKSVLISPQWATHISWDERKVDLGIRRETIKAGPEWSATYPVDAGYAEELARHYAGIPGWRGRDRSLEPLSSRAPAGDEASMDDGALGRADARVAAHEEAQILAADAAVSRDAHEGRIP
jgi:hypothetical protein